MEKIVIEKYEFRIPEGEEWNHMNFECFRHGEHWRTLTGDGMVLALCQRVLELEEILQTAGITTHKEGK